MKYSANPKLLENDDLAEIAWNAIEPLWNDLPYSNLKKLDAFLSEVTEGQRALIAIDWCQKEIRNGGIKQLFTNSSGNLVPYAIEGFKLIHAPIYSAMLQEAASLLGKEYPKTITSRKNALKSLSKQKIETLQKIDENFFTLLFSNEHDIEKYRGNYVKQNIEQFINS